MAEKVVVMLVTPHTVMQNQLDHLNGVVLHDIWWGGQMASFYLAASFYLSFKQAPNCELHAGHHDFGADDTDC